VHTRAHTCTHVHTRAHTCTHVHTRAHTRASTSIAAPSGRLGAPRRTPTHPEAPWRTSAHHAPFPPAVSGPRRLYHPSTLRMPDPILAYSAESEVNQLQWSKTQPDWVAIAFDKKLQILRV
jgi:hypothetical protein